MAPRHGFTRAVLRNASRYAPYIRAGVRAGSAILKLRNAANRRTSTGRQLKYATGGVVTRQKDFARTYHKRRPSRKRRRLRKFAKRVKRAMQSSLPLNTYTNPATEILLSASLGFLGPAFQITLDSKSSVASRNDFRLGQNISNQGWNDFIQNVATSTIDQPGTVTMKGTDPENLDFWMNAAMNITFKNISGQLIMVDVYECVANQDIGPGPFDSAKGAWDECIARTNFPDGTGSGSTTVPNVNTAGLTPFDAPEFGAYWRILNRQRFELGTNNLVSINAKIRSRPINYAKWNGKAVKKGYTKDFIIIALPTYNDFAVATDLISIQWTKAHHFRLPDYPVFQNSYMATKTIL